MSNVELEASEALLDVGVSLPFKEIRLPFFKRPIVFRITMRRPCLGNQIRIARHYLKLETTYEKMLEFNKEEEMAFLDKHGARLSKMIALTVCRGFITGWLLSPLMAFIIRWFVPDMFLQGANLKFVTLLGTKSFTNIIRSTQITNPLRPRLSHQKKGS